MPALSAEEIDRTLPAGWGLADETATAITRTWTLKGFNGAMRLVNLIAYVAEEIKHHPSITVHDYNQVTVVSTTHDTGGVTSDGDLRLAQRVNDALAAIE